MSSESRVAKPSGLDTEGLPFGYADKEEQLDKGARKMKKIKLVTIFVVATALFAAVVEPVPCAEQVPLACDGPALGRPQSGLCDGNSLHRS